MTVDGHAWGLRVLSYNLHEHRANRELAALAEQHELDALCLQECDTRDMPERIAHLERASMTDRNRLGLAVYYRADRFSLEDTRAFALRKSLHDRVMSPTHERLLAVRLKDHSREGDVVVGSFHAAPLTAGNAMRRSQVEGALGAMGALAPGSPRLMVGDYNYPVFQRGFARYMLESGFVFSRSDSPTYMRGRWFKGHFDFATSNSMTVDRVSTLPKGASDHLPILIEARYGQADAAGAATDTAAVDEDDIPELVQGTAVGS